jgi:hypothetical protein
VVRGLTLAPSGAVLTAAAIFLATAGGVLSYPLTRKPGRNGVRTDGQSTADFRLLAVVAIDLALGAALALARTLGG